ncbi:MAG: DUF3604 domain-containing protein, partial [Gammaproteobacteria bacterium]
MNEVQLFGSDSARLRRSRTMRMPIILVASTLLLASCSDSNDSVNTDSSGNIITFGEEPTCANYNELRAPYLGDTHVHTMRSFDSFAFDVGLTPDDAFRFARGEEVGLTPYNNVGEPMRHAKLETALDWAMLSDHAELFGEASICTDPSFEEYGNFFCELYRVQNRTTFNLFGAR